MLCFDSILPLTTDPILIWVMFTDGFSGIDSLPIDLNIHQNQRSNPKDSPKVYGTPWESPFPMPIQRIPLEGHPFPKGIPSGWGGPRDSFGGCLTVWVLGKESRGPSDWQTLVQALNIVSGLRQTLY